MLSGIRRIKAIEIGEDDEQIRTHEVRNVSGQGVIIPELDLIRGHAVVFVDNRHGSDLEQSGKRAANVEVTHSIVQDVIGGKKHLADGETMFPKSLLIAVHQLILTDGRRRLELGERSRPGAKSQPSHTRTDGPRGDDGCLNPTRMKNGHLIGDPLDDAHI